MKCPHCLVEIHSSAVNQNLTSDEGGIWRAKLEVCPSCKKIIITLLQHQPKGGIIQSFLAYPKGITRAPLSKDVPKEFAIDYKEACLVLSDSPKSSAALSRRCLQHLLREKANVTPKTLADEIQQALDSNQLPTQLAEGIDAVRNIGNFAAHATKSTNTGEIVDVEPGEAEWLLDILEGLFDFYFVQPAILKAKRAQLNKKLKDAGKPELK